MLTNQPVELIFKQISYLPLPDVKSFFRVNRRTHDVGTHGRYNMLWKSLTKAIYGEFMWYDENLKELWQRTHTSGYTYLVYTELVKLFDPVTRLLICNKLGDTNFESKEYELETARFLLGKKLPKHHPLSLVADEKHVSQDDLNKALTFMIRVGSPRGLMMLIHKGAKIRADRCKNATHINVMRCLIQQGIDINMYDGRFLHLACQENNFRMVKLLVESGADIHHRNDEAVKIASQFNHIKIAKYLIEFGADVYSDNCVLIHAVSRSDLDTLKYLHMAGVDIYMESQLALRTACGFGHLDIVKYLVRNGGDIHIIDDDCLKTASYNGHLDLMQYLIQQGADVEKAIEFGLDNNICPETIEYLRGHLR